MREKMMINKKGKIERDRDIKLNISRETIEE